MRPGAAHGREEPRPLGATLERLAPAAAARHPAVTALETMLALTDEVRGCSTA